MVDPRGNPAMPPIQLDSLVINFHFDIIRKKCIHCGQLILRKISKIGATRCQILRLKCIKFDPLGLRPRPHWGSLQRSPRPLAEFKGPTTKEREGKEEEGKERGMEREGEFRGGEGREGLAPNWGVWIRQCM